MGAMVIEAIGFHDPQVRGADNVGGEYDLRFSAGSEYFQYHSTDRQIR
jgi:hypothetical protein